MLRSAFFRKRPPGYPREIEGELALADGRVVRVRPIVPDDADQLRQEIEDADAETLRSRFLGGRPPTDDATLQRLCTVDYDRRLALVAFGPHDKGVAIARYEGQNGSDVAEVAVVVDPAWRHVGVASGMLRLLAEAALARGVTHFTATVFADNVDVHDIVSRSGLPVFQQYQGGVVDEVVELDETTITTT
jgi:RimJ/RimL family protein N-acetyltransferase